jgi:hypothetical protein
MAGKILNGVKYIELCSNREKSETLVDRVIDVLRDIFWNGGDSDLVLDANDTVKLIVRDNMYIDGSRSNEILYKYRDNIQRIFKYIKESSFDFEGTSGSTAREQSSLEEGDFDDNGIYVEFSVWYENFKIIKSEIESLS